MKKSKFPQWAMNIVKDKNNKIKDLKKSPWSGLLDTGTLRHSSPTIPHPTIPHNLYAMFQNPKTVFENPPFVQAKYGQPLHWLNRAAYALYWDQHKHIICIYSSFLMNVKS